jgi:hypothetical protein
VAVVFKMAAGRAKQRHAAREKRGKIGGVGTELKAMLAILYRLRKPGSKCGCEARAEEMDRRGIPWCEANRDTIIAWLREGAEQLSVPFLESPARWALTIAIRRARLKEQQRMQAHVLEQEAPNEEPLPEVHPVDDPLITYDAHGTVTNGLKNLWRGCAGFLVCGGPSINALPYHRLAERGICSLAVNNVAGKVPVRAMTFSDPPEKFDEAIFRDPAMMKLVPKPKLTRGETRRKLDQDRFEYTGRNVRDYPNVWGYERRSWWTPESFLTDPAASNGNNNKGVEKTKRPKILCTMFLGLRLMHFLGVRRVYLLGVDFWMDPALAQDGSLSGNYAFDDARYDGMADRQKAREEALGVINGNNNIYRVANDMLIELRPYLDAAGFEVFNCNEWSRLQAFEHVPFDEALEDCHNGVPEGDLDLRGWYAKGER